MPPPRRSSLRASALLVAGALLLHELRYLVGWGGGAGKALADHGHAYLSYAMPLAVVLLGAALAQVLVRLGGPPSRPPGPRAWVRGWALASGALLAIYVAQETLEGLLEAGHPPGVAGVFGHGGLVSVPLALAIGALLALVEHGARATLAAPARLRPAAAITVSQPPLPLSRPTRLHPPTRTRALARHLCGRAPPAAFR